jgi:hypothetical protein
MEGQIKMMIRGNLPYQTCMTTDHVVTVTRMMMCMSAFNKSIF